jgi:uncharacterized phage-associated protein
MANVFDVAKYVLKSVGTTTTMKLQKLTYYCQAWSLAWDEEPLFDEDFQAWANGPVCPELFDRHKRLFSVSAALFESVGDYSFTETQLETMESVLGYYGDKDPQWLSELTHQERPWKETRGNTPAGEHCTSVIPKSLMQEYYSGLI